MMSSVEKGPAERPGARTALEVAVVVVLAVAPYLGALGHDFLTWDDNIIILNQPFLRELTWQNIWTALSPVPAREEWLPLRDLTLMANFALFGAEAGWFAAGNILLHAGASVAVLFLLRRLTGNQVAALLGAALFACHAVHVESVTWLSGRKDPLSALFLVTGLIAHIRFRSLEGSYATVVVLLVLALTSKASAFVFPLWAFAYDLCFRRDLGLKARVAPIVPYAALSGAMVLTFLKLISADGVIEEYPGGGLWSVLLTNVVSFKSYTLDAFLPIRHQAIYPVRFVGSILDAELWASACFLGAIGLAAWRARSRPWIPFSVLFFYGSFLPYVNVVPHGIYYAERYLYLPTVASSLLLGKAFASLLELPRDRPLVRRLVWGALALLAAVHSIAACSRSEVWATSESFWAYQAAVLPGNPAPLMNLGETRELAGDDAAAARTYEQILDRFGTVPEAIHRLARIARRQGSLEGAIRLYGEHARLCPGDPRSLNNLAEALLAAGRRPEAIDVLERACGRHPRYLPARANLARALEAEGRSAEAQAHWQAIVERAELLTEEALLAEARTALAESQARD